ncbi:MAG: GDYXXLXY domain-containing protein [Halobacteriota archaeon]|nr:GDYXXLXY domain-containing protein [Halobacteriota archaeon]
MDKKEFMLLMLVPAVVIIALLSVHLYILSFGQEILLEIPEPIDPRDLFRGDYVRLNYEISQINLTETSYDYGFSRGEPIYATLSEKEKFWTIDSVSHTEPTLINNQVFMKGEVTSVYKDRVRVKWGIESFFVPEGEGLPIERHMGKGNVSIVVKVGYNGYSVIKELLINDEVVKFG